MRLVLRLGLLGEFVLVRTELLLRFLDDPLPFLDGLQRLLRLGGAVRGHPGRGVRLGLSSFESRLQPRERALTVGDLLRPPIELRPLSLQAGFFLA